MSISVIIPTYNRELLLEAAIQSALCQTLRVTEVIVVDDGSTDQTEALVARLTAADPRVRLLKQQRGGANRARNAGSKSAVGDWLAFLDSDDVWEPNKLELQMHVIGAYEGVVASFTGLRHVGSGSGRVFLPPEMPSLDDIRAANVLSSTSTAVIRTSVFWEVGGFDPNLPSCQDWDLWFRLRQKGMFLTVRQPLVRYNCGPHDRISSNMSRVIDGHKELFRRLKVGIEGDKGALRKVTSKHKILMAEVHLKCGDPGNAMWLCLASLVSRPSRWGLRMLGSSARAWVAGVGKRLPLGPVGS